MKLLTVTGKMFSLLKDNNQALGKLVYPLGCTWSTIYNNVKEFKKRGLVTSRRKGNKTVVTLTKKGEEVYKAVNLIRSIEGGE